MYIILAILAFGILIAVHELGHFLTAKLFGVRVNEFALGMGPKLLKKQGKETLYSLRAFPIGGFCAMEGEDGDSVAPRAFHSRPAWQRAIILCAGAAMNFLLGFVLVLCISPDANFAEPVLTGFMPDCPYEGADGLLAGDRILRIDGHRIFFASNVSEYLARSGGDTHDITLLRDGTRLTLEDYPLTQRDYTLESGETVTRYGLYFSPRDFGFGADLRYSWYACLDFVRIVWNSLGDLFRGAVLAVRGAFEEVELPADAVVHPAELLPRAEGPGDGVRLDAEDAFELVHEVERGLCRAVHLVHEGEDGDAAHAADLEELPGALLDALGRVDDHDDGVDGGEHAVGVLGEVLVAGGVEEVDDLAAVFELQEGGGDGDAALLFELHPVGGGGALLAAGADGAGELDGAAVEEELLGEGGLAGVRVRDDREGAAAGDFGKRGGGKRGHGGVAWRGGEWAGAAGSAPPRTVPRRRSG